MMPFLARIRVRHRRVALLIIIAAAAPAAAQQPIQVNPTASASKWPAAQPPAAWVN